MRGENGTVVNKRGKKLRKNKLNPLRLFCKTQLSKFFVETENYSRPLRAGRRSSTATANGSRIKFDLPETPLSIRGFIKGSD